MKRYLYLFTLALGLSLSAAAQDGPGARVRERLLEYMQTRLSLTPAESDRFSPLLNNYLDEMRAINRQYRGDRLVQQQKIAELRLRYRDQLRPILGDKRSNDVFLYERDFVEQVKRIRRDRIQNRLSDDRPGKRF